MAETVSGRPFTAEDWVRARVINVGYVVDKVALRQVIFRVLRISPDQIIVSWLSRF
jgi:hypothetical protein